MQNLVAATPGTTMATNTATVTQVIGGKTNAKDAAHGPNGLTYFFRVRVINNDDQDAPTVQGSGTLTLTVVDVNTTTQLTSMALIGVFDTTGVVSVPTDYVFSCPLPAGTFTVVSTVSAGDTDLFVYQLDLLAVPHSPFDVSPSLLCQ